MDKDGKESDKGEASNNDTKTNIARKSFPNPSDESYSQLMRIKKHSIDASSAKYVDNADKGSKHSRGSRTSRSSKASRKSISKFHALEAGQSSVSVRVEPLASKTLLSEITSGMCLLRHDRQINDKVITNASPFALKWIHGYNPKVAVINLTRGQDTLLFYAAVNCGVLLNWKSCQMHILQGHKNMVTCIDSDGDGSWLVTADTGPENVITIWNSENRTPARTIFNPHESLKVSKVAISSDAKYLLSLGYKDKAILYWWIWSFGLNMPHACLELDVPRNAIKAMKFNPSDSTQFALLTKCDLHIGQSAKIFKMERGVLIETADYELKSKKVPRSSSVDCGRLTCLTFVSSTGQVLVGSARGVLLLYGYSLEHEAEDRSRNRSIDELKFIKAIKVEDGRINVLRSLNGLILVGDNVGQIRYFDEQLRLIYWVHGFQVDSVIDLSFDLTQKSYQVVDVKCDRWCICWENIPDEIDNVTGLPKQKLVRKKTLTTAAKDSQLFFVNDYIICTRQQGILSVDSARERTAVIVDCNCSYTSAMAVHPEKRLVSLGRDSGVVELYDFKELRVLTRLDLRDHFKVVIPPSEDSIHSAYEVLVPTLTVSCLKYAPSGLHLACGLSNGELLFLHPSTLRLLTPEPHRDTTHAIKLIDFCDSSLTLALADEGYTVCVYRYDCDASTWRFVGKHRSHYKTITTVLFTKDKNNDGYPKLLSLGMDRMMVEYDIGASEDEQLNVYSLDRMDQSASPLHAIVWPNDSNLNPEEHRTDLPLILVASDEYKYKILNYKTSMTLSTVLGPRYGTPVQHVQLISVPYDCKYLVFATKNIIGLQKLPLDGNPWKHTAILGHPLEVIEMYMRKDLDALFTIGAKDPCLMMWKAKYESVDKTSRVGGEDLDPYYCLVEGGRPGWLFTEIRDLFYYIQILCQGTVSPVMRTVKDYIPIDSLPDLMRALGFFASEFEMENLLTEARYAVYRRVPAQLLDFEQFVKLYLNHRPACALGPAHIATAFRYFANFDGEDAISREDFLEMLHLYGERFSPQLQRYLLSVLCQLSAEERVFTATDFDFLPERITLSYFMRIILGLPEMAAEGEASPRGSVGSCSVLSGSDTI